MKKLLSGFFFVAALTAVFTLDAQVAPDIEWQKTLGGDNADNSYSVAITRSGGYVVAGRTQSNNGNVSGNNGGVDFWITALDSNGNLEWQKCLGGSNYEEASSVQQTADGGFIVAGRSGSNDGNVSGNHGSFDFWVVKLDSTGNLIWQQSLGGSGDEEANSLDQTIDGGYIVAGYSNSPNDGNVSGNHGGLDYWVLKLNSNGNLLWQKSYGGSENDRAYSIQQTTDSGFIVAGYSMSNDGDVTGNHGYEDYWIVKLDVSGNLEWQKSIGGTSSDLARSIQQAKKGDFIVAGFTHSNDGDVSCNHGIEDSWIIKLDAGGNLVWQKAFGGSSYDNAYSAQCNEQGEIIVANFSQSTDGDITGNHGSGDYWIFKLNTNGDLLWEKSYGGSGDDECYSIKQTNDNGFIIAGYSYSKNGDVTENHGYDDYWIVKLKAETDECDVPYDLTTLSISSTKAEATWEYNGTPVAFKVRYKEAGSSKWSREFVNGINHSAKLKSLSPNTEYVWQVKAACDNHSKSDYTEPKVHFTTLLREATIADGDASKFEIFPNPAQSQLTINLTAPVDEASIHVYDMQGIMIALPSSNFKFQTPNSIQLNISSLPDGFYTLQIINNETGTSVVRKFVKQQ